MDVYRLESRSDYMAYELCDEQLQKRMFYTGKTVLPELGDLPLRLQPSFGDAKKQPTKLGELHRVNGGPKLFSERSVQALGLHESGRLFPAVLAGRDEPFYWYWSTTVIDCLDNTRTKWFTHLILEPAFYLDRVGDAEIFTVPEDQKFQFSLFVTDKFQDKIKKAKLKGFSLERRSFDPKPWKS